MKKNGKIKKDVDSGSRKLPAKASGALAVAEPREYSGQFRVRMPKELHRKLSEEAGRNNVSLNTYIVYLLSEKNGARANAGARANVNIVKNVLNVRVQDADNLKDIKPVTPYVLL